MPRIKFNDFSDLFSYDPETGYLLHKRDWGVRKAGDRACQPHSLGYLRVTVSGKYYFVHRIAWFLMTGEHPAEQIDHINGCKSDNRWCNLRAASNGENSMNRKKLRNNTSGFKNVHFHKPTGLWRARVVKNRVETCDFFKTPEEAHARAQELRRDIHEEFRNG